VNHKEMTLEARRIYVREGAVAALKYTKAWCEANPRERRKATTVGERKPEAPTVAERSQQAIEAGVWPLYWP
jgi:hypothetical protein